ncbi:hypothetical protein [Glycomyces dulcitolivorans]|jgi:hypothetical protein|uniref:hypothetical protein n=1 Tax=Glycomyces dulcitolivorans TaxID=2200759 RepID=UPI000DD4B9CB|nr:hypothetical protein [Glycomyces dulcitolivorans]
MTYPPPGGENPQYQLQPEPQQPSDPYAQGYNTPPPPTNYYQQQPGYSQPQMQQPPQYTQPGPPQMGVQPGYPTAPGQVLPPPIPPAKQGGNLGVILAVVVGLVIVLGVAAVLLIPKLTEDDADPQAGGGDDTSEAEEPEQSDEPATEPSEEETDSSDTGGSTLEGWGAPVSSDSFDANTPEGAAITYRQAADTDDDAALQSVVCATPSDDMQFDVDWELEYEGGNYGFLLWSMSKVEGGETLVWVGWTLDDLPPDSADDLSSGYTFTAVEEEGAWKLCHVDY